MGIELSEAQKISVCLLVDDVGAEAGTERQVSETVLRLDKARFDVYLCCLEDSPRFRHLGQFCRTALFPVTRIYTPAGLRQLLRFRRYLKAHRIQIVQAFMVKTAVFGVLAARLSKGPLVITSRLNTGYWYTPTLVRVFRYLNRHTARVFANSVGAGRIAIETEALPPGKVDVIYQGIDVERFAAGRGDPGVAALLGIPGSARVVGMVANLRPVKDVPLFLRAAALVAARVPGVAFLLVGQGSLRQSLGRLAGELGIAGQVFFADGRGSVPDHLARMSVACMSSESEGLSNAILEYMAAGLPVVATDVGGNAEVIVHGETGYLVREREPEAFAAPIVELLRDEERRVAMGRCGLERCREMFEINGYVRRMEQYYMSLMGAA